MCVSILMNHIVSIVIISMISVTIARDTALSYVPVVMLGYDVVAYHLNVTGCDSILGNKKYSYQLSSTDGNGIERLYEFWFADKNNLNTFKSDPWRWAPRFGGFCSFGTCCELAPSWLWSSTFQGPPAGPDKTNCGFRIHTDGYLYFNIRKYYDETFFSNADANIQAAEDRWIQWFGSLTAGPFNHYCFSTFGHETIDECVKNAQRYAPAVNKNDEIYPIDEDYNDDWFNQYDTLNGSDANNGSDIIACTAICRTCSDGSCQPRDEKCAWLACPNSSQSSYLIFGVIGLMVLLVIVVAVAFQCYKRKNVSLKQNFEQLAHDENTKNENGEPKQENMDLEMNNSNETIHDNILQTETDIAPR